MLKTRVYYSIIIAITFIFISSCNNNFNKRGFLLLKTDVVEIEENDEVILSNPDAIELINDSLCLVLNKEKKIIVYNIYTGKINTSFTYPKLNFDSLFFSNDIQKNYTKRDYSKEIKNEYGLQEEFIQSFYYDREKKEILLHFYKLYPYYEYTGSNKSKSINTVFAFEPFLIYLNSHGEFKKVLNISTVVPNKPEVVPAFSWGFNIFMDTFYVQNWTVKYKDKPLLLKYVVNKNELVYKGTSFIFPINYNKSLNTYFYNQGNEMYFTDQKNIFDIRKNLIFSPLKDIEDEFIQKIKATDNGLFFVSKLINENDKQYMSYINYLDFKTNENTRIDTITTFLSNYGFYERKIISLVFNSQKEKFEFFTYEIQAKE